MRKKERKEKGVLLQPDGNEGEMRGSKKAEE